MYVFIRKFNLSRISTWFYDEIVFHLTFISVKHHIDTSVDIVISDFAHMRNVGLPLRLIIADEIMTFSFEQFFSTDDGISFCSDKFHLDRRCKSKTDLL